MSLTAVNLAQENTVDECSLRLDLPPGLFIVIQATKKINLFTVPSRE